MRTERFQKIIYDHYKKHGRHDLPWRIYDSDVSQPFMLQDLAQLHRAQPEGLQINPYKIVVSEVMLQQTQVSRVMYKYAEFIERFPMIESLASAKLSEVLTLWQGMGYNRRAKYLRDAVRIMMEDKKYGFLLNSHSALDAESIRSYRSRIGVRDDKVKTLYQVQKQYIEPLIELPGIGHATAAAIVAYAFNLPTVFIETNIRAAYLYHFFPKKHDVSDKEIEQLVKETLDHKNPRNWYYAVTDYGNYLKTKKHFVNKQSKHYTKQSKFHGSRRQLRGQIIKLLIEKKSMNRSSIYRQIHERTEEEIDSVVQDLKKERMIELQKDVVSLT